MPSARRARLQRFLQQAAGWIVISLIAAVISFFLAPTILSRWIESQVYNASGLSLDIHGMRIGTSIRVAAIEYRKPGDPEPLVLIRDLELVPHWLTLLRGLASFSQVHLGSVDMRWDPALLDRYHAPSGPRSSEIGLWIAALRVDSYVCLTPFGRWSGRIALDGLSTEHVQSACVSYETEMGKAHGFIEANNFPGGVIRWRISGTRPRDHLQHFPWLSNVPDISSVEEWRLHAHLHQFRAGPSVVADSSLPTALSWIDSTESAEVIGDATMANGETHSIEISTNRRARFARIDVRAGVTGRLSATVSVNETVARFAGVASCTTDALRFDDGRIDLIFSLEPRHEILPGSAVQLKRVIVKDAPLGSIRALIRGDEVEGYSIAVTGSGIRMTASLNPASRAGTIAGSLALPRAGPLRDVKLNGVLEAKHGAEGWMGNWNGAVGLEYPFKGGTAAIRASIQSRMTARGMSATVENVQLDARIAKNRLAACIPSVLVVVRSGLHVTLLRPARLICAGAEVSLEGEAHLDEGGSGEITHASLNGIPFSARFSSSGGALRSATVALDHARADSILTLLPVAMRKSLDGMSIKGDLSSRLVWHHHPDRIEGEIGIVIDSLRHPGAKIEIRNLKAEIPVRLRLEDPSKVKLPAEEVWPDLPVNLRAEKIVIGEMTIGAIEARSIFSHYVLRCDVTGFDLFGGRGSSWIWLDPWREKSGRMRVSFGAKLDRAELRKIYEAFVGRGPEASALAGAVDFELETGWSDTECVELTGEIRSRGGGRIGSRVIRALAQLAPKEKRPPDIAAALIGDYKFDALRLKLFRDTEVRDIMAVVDLTTPRRAGAKVPSHAYPNTITPWIEDLHLDLPLFALLEGLPAEMRSDFSRSKRQRR